MNILYIHTHDTGRFIQPYGYQVETPNLMRFAERGTVFRSAFSAAPTCSPSRAALLTGEYPHNCGMFGLAHRGFEMPDYSHHIASYLKSFGYETVLCGIQHEAPDAAMIGYTRILDDQKFNMGCLEFDSETFDMENAERVCSYLESELHKPFFLSFGLFNTHRNYPEISADINPNYVMSLPGLPDCEQIRKDTAAFITSARIADAAIGKVLQKLEDSGLAENTIVLYTTDHGLAFPGMKCTLYDQGTSVGLIFDYPGNPSKGKVCDSLVSHIDVVPTIYDLCKIEKPQWLQGESLVPIFEGKENEIRQEVYSEVTFHAAYEPMRAVRTKRYKFIRRYDDELSVMLANIDDSPSKSFLFKNGCFKMPYNRTELYDLYRDPDEKNNLVGKEEYIHICKKMSGLLDTWMEENGDPLLDGHMRAPKGAFVNSAHDYTAKRQ